MLVAILAQPVFADPAPERYLLTYPAAEQFCPPVDGFFDEVERTIDRVRGRTFRHQPNGGYGLPVVDKVGDAHLLHLGADVGWYRVGDPVFAVANGVVRISQGQDNNAPASQASPGSTDRAGRGRKGLAWGNVVVIEHRFAGGKYATAIYGHLANERLVKAGDVVHAGQQIGTIGTTKVNGGYKPHLHLGVREGRMAEAGRKLLLMTTDGKLRALEIAEVKEQEESVVLKGGADLPGSLTMGLDGKKFDIRHRGGEAGGRPAVDGGAGSGDPRTAEGAGLGDPRTAEGAGLGDPRTAELDIRRSGENVEVSAELLSYLPSPEFAIVGYGLSTDGWRDPIAFLKAHGADTNPAPFEPAKKRRR